jgi:hypothetical protein
MLFGFDASQVREVGRGSRSSSNTGINPIELGNWHVKFPNIPLNRVSQGSGAGPVPRPAFDYLANTGAWDPAANQLIWIQPGSTMDYTGTMQIFTIKNGGPAAPTNLHIVR